MRNVRVDTEAGAQELIMMWANRSRGYYPELALLFHIPNGGKRDAKEAAHFKRLGVKAGVPDLCLPVARNGYHGLYIELKVGSNKQSATQKEWQELLSAQGYLAVVCYGHIEAITVIEKYINGVYEDKE